MNMSRLSQLPSVASAVAPTRVVRYAWLSTSCSRTTVSVQYGQQQEFKRCSEIWANGGENPKFRKNWSKST